MSMNTIKTISTISLLVLAALSFSFRGKSVNYINYHKSIHKADSLILNKNYAGALIIYEELLNAYPHFFRKDLHNATVCAILLKDYNKAEKYALILVNHGYELNDFERPAFEELRNQEQWQSFLKKYKEKRQNYLNGLNKDERNKYSQLLTKDQAIALSSQQKQISIERQDKGFETIEQELLQLISEYGFPTTFINKDTLKAKTLGMFRHICGMRNARMENEHPLKNILYTALVNGHILPEEYSSVLAYRGENYYGDISINMNFKEKSVTMRSDGNMHEINKRRDAIGLFPLDSVTISHYLMNSWYGKIPFEKIRQKKFEYEKADSSKLSFIIWQEKELQKVQKQYEKGEDSSSLFILPLPQEVKNRWNYY